MKNTNSNTCKNCINWDRVSNRTGQKGKGICKFMNNRVNIVWENKVEQDPDYNSLVIISSSQICGNIGDLEISSTSKNLIHRHTFVWTDSNFGCTMFKK